MKATSWSTLRKMMTRRSSPCIWNPLWRFHVFATLMSRLRKPVVLLKGGTSAEGARAAQSHTGSLAGDARLTEGFLRQMKIHRATDFFEMVDMTRGLSLWQGRGRGTRIGIVTFSGASGIVACRPFCRPGHDPGASFSGDHSNLADGFSPMDDPSESCGCVAGH